MIQTATQQPRKSRPVPRWHAGFLAMLPSITLQARVAFRNLPPEAKSDAVQEVTANVLVAYVRLVKLKKVKVAYPTVLAKYAIAQVREGQLVGNQLNVYEVLSRYAQHIKGFSVERLDHFDKEAGEWQEAVIEDHRTPVADQAAFRIDFPAWLATHPRRDRRIVETLAAGHTTTDVARRFHVTPGRISQKRREFHESWQTFHGENPSDAQATEDEVNYERDAVGQVA